MSETINRKRLFTGCVVSLVATSFGFAARAAILGDWEAEFNLSQEQIGYVIGAGLAPFALSIILFSLIIDRIGNGVSMAIAFTLHVASAIITLAAPLALAPAGSGPEAIAAGQKAGFLLLYVGTFIFALGNGTIEAVVNPVTATLFSREKTKYLNILHAGWPGGLVLGGLVAIALSTVAPGTLPGRLWQWKVGLVLIPTLAYGLMLYRQRFPVQERVLAKVPYFDMLREFGAGSAYIVSFFVISALNQVLVILGIPTFSLPVQLLMAAVPTIAFAMYVKSFGRPMFFLLLLVMVLLATTELGTDGWISDIMRTVLDSPTQGTLFLVWTSFIMFVLRFFAGPLVHRLGPLGLLAGSAAVAALGLLWLSGAGSSAAILFLAATFYGLGKSFFWPTTLGVVSEQYPRGGALMLNAIAGVGMISVGAIGLPAIGALQDRAFSAQIAEFDPALAGRVLSERPGLFGVSHALDPAKRSELESAAAASPGDAALATQVATVTRVDATAKQGTLGRIALLPTIMLLCYLALIAYFRSRGGYKAVELRAEG
jgi:MFS family permease